MQSIKDIARHGNDDWKIIYRRGIFTRLRDFIFFIVCLLLGSFFSAAVLVGVWDLLEPGTLPPFLASMAREFKSPIRAVLMLVLGVIFGYWGLAYVIRQVLDWILPPSLYTGKVTKFSEHMGSKGGITYYIHCEDHKWEVPKRIQKQLYMSQPVIAKYHRRTEELLRLLVPRGNL